jgi:hypothetical protein
MTTFGRAARERASLFQFHISWRTMVCPIFHHLDCYIRANRAFKSTFIVVRLVRLDAGEPHLCLADFAKRATDDPLLRKILILSHTTPRFSVTDA